jgi:glycosyltransferase involved in cell wall biosynthesis
MRHQPSAISSAWPIAGGHISVALVVGTLAHAGVPRYVTALARALGEGRHRVHVYVLAGSVEPSASRLRALGIPITALARRRAYEPGRVFALARALTRDGIDLVHAILPAGAAYGALAARLAGVPVVIVSTRAGDPREERRVRTLLHRIYRRATVVLANTRAQARQVAREAALPLEQVQVVYDGVDLSRQAAPGMFDGLRDRVWHRPLVIGGVGSGESGRALFSATAARIAARHPAAHFVWLEERDAEGEAPDAKGRPACAPGGLPLSVVALADDPQPALSQIAILCLTGGPACASLGLVPAAMAAGRPVVAADVPGIDELIADGVMGAIVPPGDPTALAEAAIALLEDPRRLRSAGRAARAHAKQALGAAGMARATAALYEASLLGQIVPGTRPAVGRVSPLPAEGHR